MKTKMTHAYLPLFIILLLFFMTWAFSHIWSRHMATELGYEISERQSEKEGLISDNKSLRLEISTLKSSKRLELIAKHELGLKSPASNQVVYLWLDE